MYSDRDGTATRQSQAVYDDRVRSLLLITSLLSSIGLGASALNGEYTETSFSWTLSIWGLHVHPWSQLLWPILCFNSLISLYRTDQPLKVYKAGLVGSALSAFIVFARLRASLGENEDDVTLSSLASLQLYAAILLSVIQALIPRRPDLFTSHGQAVDLENSASALGRYSMNWCTTALAIAGRSGAVNAFPVIGYTTRSKSQLPIVPPSSKPYVWNRILTERFLGFAKQWALMFIKAGFVFGSPYCIMQLLKCLEDQGRNNNEAWLWLIAIGASNVCQTTVSHQLVWVQWSEMGVPVRAQLIMSIFQKTLRRKDSKEQEEKASSKSSSHKPDAINLVAADTQSLAKFTAVNYIIPSTFLKFGFAVAFLFNLLGWQSTVAAVLTSMLSLLAATFTIKQQRATRKKLVTSRDKTTGVLKEALYSLRQIKFSALEKQWEEHINTYRQEELKQLKQATSAKSARALWNVTMPFLIATVSIVTYIWTGGEAGPSVVFTMAALLPILQESIRIIPLVLLDYFESVNTAGRIDKYLAAVEQKSILGPSPSGSVKFENATITWPSDAVQPEVGEKQVAASHRFSLRDLNLDFPARELSVISGKTGSGKSLLLAAIIGEVELLDGSINSPSAAGGSGPIAFVSQTPWLQSTTIKENILFGSPFNKSRYDKVVAACALERDLAALANGDDTQIGLRGVKLSGGQRTRLAFARALYSSARLLVLDDIFSALDSHVSKDILGALTGELGMGRTRILVTHHVSLCLPNAAYLVCLENNSVAFSGKPNAAGREAASMAVLAHLDTTSPKEESSLSSDDEKHKGKSSNKVSKVSYTRNDWKLYKTYFAAAGGLLFTIFFALSLVLTQLLDAWSTYSLGCIKSAKRVDTAHQVKSSAHSDEDRQNALQTNVYMYLGASILAIALQSLSSPYMYAGGIRASKTLFRQGLFRVTRMPLHWLDATPIGEVLKSLTVDVRTVDEWVLITVSEVANSLVKLTTVVCVGLYTSKYTGFLTIVLLFWCSRVARGYVKGGTVAKRADARPMADILEQFTSTMAGISTIRAFGATNLSEEEMHRNIDRLSTARRHFWIFNRWLGLQMSFIGIVFTMGTGVFLLSPASIVDTSRVGFALTFSMGLYRAVFDATNQFGSLENHMNALSAVMRYTELETEPQGGVDVPPDWPSNGEVNVQELEVSYAADLPLVLKSVSFTVKGGQRIGVVGRTGAGKSSLTLSLLRLLEPRGGLIEIDGIDISTAKLTDLRSRIAFIPQDPTLFSGTVRSNLDYFKEVKTERLEEALRRVKLLAEAGDEKSGLFTIDSPISAGGANMSQGQRQLLCLARILIKTPKIIVLDEATSAVDNKTDTLIQEIIRTQFTGTLIVVAHRLRTIAAFDQVMVISDGRVAEIGQPAELLKRDGIFSKLVNDSQDKEFLHKIIIG